MVQDLSLNEGHVHDIGMVLVYIVVENLGVVAKQLQLRPLLTLFQHQRKVAQTVIEFGKMRQFLGSVTAVQLHVTAKGAVGLLRKFSARTTTCVFQLGFLLAPKVVPPHSTLAPRLRLPEKDSRLSRFEAADGHNACALVGASLSLLGFPILLRQIGLRSCSGNAAQRKGLQRSPCQLAITEDIEITITHFPEAPRCRAKTCDALELY
mmetsp:Transcript_37469/g.99594  ORF Transcript_37469/g.99594 Transcript_37469/m.99594 type:complete len:208 (-) Transcript_37469:17-640(-)